MYHGKLVSLVYYPSLMFKSAHPRPIFSFRKLKDQMREARDRVHRVEEARLWEIEWREKQRLRIELSEQIQEEEKRIQDLDGLVDGWVRAKQMREFIAALEKSWTETKEELSPDSPRAKKLAWMKQQADRLDPPHS